jgi:hypothetical protein
MLRCERWKLIKEIMEDIRTNERGGGKRMKGKKKK